VTASDVLFRSPEVSMLLAIGIVLLILWLAGFIAFKVTAWFIHVLIVLAVIAFIMHFARGRSATP